MDGPIGSLEGLVRVIDPVVGEDGCVRVVYCVMSGDM